MQIKLLPPGNYGGGRTISVRGSHWAGQKPHDDGLVCPSKAVRIAFTK
jgi:hypothetical protein